MKTVKELWSAFLAWRIWLFVALDDVANSYRRTFLGPLWLVVSQAGFVAGVYLLHRVGFGGGGPEFLIYLGAGLPIWGLITGLLTNGAASMMYAKDYLESFPLPPALFAFRIVASNFYGFAHLILVFVGTVIFFRFPLQPTMLAAIPAFLLLAIFGLGVSLGLGPLGARYRDIPVAITAFMGLLFVMTPIFWVATEAQLASPLVRFNPLYYLLEVARAPLLGSWGDPTIWLVATFVSFSTAAVGVFIYVRMRNNLIYWL